MAIHIIKSKNPSMGYMAYEPKYKKSAIFSNGRFIGWGRKEEVRSMIAVSKTLPEVLSRAISRKIK